MSTDNSTPLRDHPSQPSSTRPDDLAYISPMAAFLALTWAGGQWPAFFAASYYIKTILAAALLLYFRKRYTAISWRYWQLGLLVGVIGIVQWVGMEKLLLHFWPHYPRPSFEIFDPRQHFSSPTALWSFAIIRIADATLVVPFMEELFWRDYLWRSVPELLGSRKTLSVGDPDWRSVIIVSAAFASVHIQWMTAIVYGLMIAALLIRTRSLGACIIAHAVTNLLLGVYVEYTRTNWYFW